MQLLLYCTIMDGLKITEEAAKASVDQDDLLHPGLIFEPVPRAQIENIAGSSHGVRVLDEGVQSEGVSIPFHFIAWTVSADARMPVGISCMPVGMS